MESHIPVIHIRLLGDFQVTIGGRTIDGHAWRLKKAATLVKLLALSSNHRLHREQALDLLWPDLEPQAAINNLHHALHVARRILHPPDAVGTPCLRIQGELISLDPVCPVVTDVASFEAAASKARQRRDTSDYRAAIALYGGDLLPDDIYDDWWSERRDGLRLLHLRLLTELGHLEESAGSLGAAMEALQCVVKIDPIREDAHVGLMRLYARTGQRHGALRQFEQLRVALRRDLDVEPEGASSALYAEILTGQYPTFDETGATEQVSGAAAGLQRRQSNLPMSLTTFIGRESAIAEVRSMLKVSRLLTLTGAGGAGKTRLAVEAVRGLVDHYAHGVWLVNLAPLNDGHLVAQTVAQVLDVREQPPLLPIDALVESLNGRTILLVLDNCEHVIDACAELALTLLSSCPRVRILATGREALGVPGEVTWAVPPLAVPDPYRLPPLDALTGCESMRLFEDRARHRHQGFSIDRDNAAAVATICKQLDGLPLAIELAAARVGLLSTQQISTRLHDSLSLLTAGKRTALPHQQTLRATLDWSYNLLSADERAVFERLSAFSGGWTLEAAEVVANIDGSQESGVLGLLARLVDKSLVVADTSPGATIRYRMLEPIRQYGRQKLEDSGHVGVVRNRHASLFLTIAEGAEPQLKGPKQAQWMRTLEVEHANLRAAIEWSLEQNDVETALRIAGNLSRFWVTHGHISEGRRQLDEALSQGSEASSYARARALNGAGNLARYSGDYLRAIELHRQALSLRREMGDIAGVASSLNHLGLIARHQGDYARARALCKESLAIRRDIGDIVGAAGTLNILGTVAANEGDFTGAIALHEESIALRRQIGDTVGLANSLNNLGLAVAYLGDFTRAIEVCEETLAMRLTLGDKIGIASVLTCLGTFRLYRGDYDRALDHQIEGMRLFWEQRHKEGVAYCAEGLAGLAAAWEQPEAAATLRAAAGSMRVAIGAPLPAIKLFKHGLFMAAAKGSIDAGSWENAWRRGKSMTVEELVEFALSMVPPDTSPTDEEVPAKVRLDGLSPRESQIALLLTNGLTNRQIATRLSIAERTVDTHVCRILGKLDLSSRAQVADRIGERRLVKDAS